MMSKSCIPFIYQWNDKKDKQNQFEPYWDRDDLHTSRCAKKAISISELT